MRSVTGIAPFATTRSRLAVEVEVHPGHAPSGERRVEGAGEARPRVREASRTPAREDAVQLPVRVRDDEVRPSVGVEVARGDAHAGVPVGDAFAHAALDEPEAEADGVRVRSAGPGNVAVEPVRIEVVCDVEVGASVSVVVGEERAEAVVDPVGLDARLLSDLPEPRMSRSCPGRG